MDCFPASCPSDVNGEVITDFINQFAKELSVKDLYFIVYNKDELHKNIVERAMESYAYNQSLFQKAQDHACQLVLQLPAFRMSVDLGEGLLEHNHFLIPDIQMLSGYKSPDRKTSFRQASFGQGSFE